MQRVAIMTLLLFGAREAHAGAHYELALIPLLGGDTDLGVAIGAIASVARLSPGDHPYTWRAEVLALSTFADGPGGELRMPFQDYYVRLILPDLFERKLRLSTKLSYSRYNNVLYAGIGNASTIDHRRSARYYEFAHNYPVLTLLAEARAIEHVYLITGGTYTYNDVVPHADSLLAEDAAHGLRGAGRYGVAQLISGLVWDGRDNPVSTTSGGHHELTVRVCPGHAIGSLDTFGGLNVALRWFIPFLDGGGVLAFRWVGDVLFGEPPFYELAKAGNDAAPGGGIAVRGIPAQRYYGMIKTFGNVELRARFASFEAFAEKIALGAVVFVDAGRVWADYAQDRGRDGDGVGLKYGAGGGVRVYWNESFVVRVDLAWSPDAAPIAAYVNAGHIF